MRDGDADFLARAAEHGSPRTSRATDPEAVQGAIEVALRRYRETAQLAGKVDELEGALQRRVVIERAKGILMERHSADERRGVRAAARERARELAAASSTSRSRSSTATRCCPQRRRPGLARGGRGNAGRKMSPSDDPRPGKRLVLSDFKRAFQRFQGDQMTDHAAALTYYSLLSLFPALLFGVASLGYFGRQALIADAADYLLQAGAPRETVDAVTKALESAQSQRGTAFTALSSRSRPRCAARRARSARSGARSTSSGASRRAAASSARRPTTSAWTLAPARARAGHVRADLRRRRRWRTTCSAPSGSGDVGATSG